MGGRQGTCSCCSRDKIRFLWVMTIVGSGHVPSPPNLLLGFPEYLTRATPGGCSWAPGRWSWTKKSVNDCWLLLLLLPDLCSAILQPSAITHLIIPAPSTAFWCQLCIRSLRTKRRWLLMALGLQILIRVYHCNISHVILSNQNFENKTKKRSIKYKYFENMIK